jgi:hypothetical protein
MGGKESSTIARRRYFATDVMPSSTAALRSSHGRPLEPQLDVAWMG